MVEDLLQSSSPSLSTYILYDLGRQSKEVDNSREAPQSIARDKLPIVWVDNGLLGLQKNPVVPPVRATILLLLGVVVGGGASGEGQVEDTGEQEEGHAHYVHAGRRRLDHTPIPALLLQSCAMQKTRRCMPMCGNIQVVIQAYCISLYMYSIFHIRNSPHPRVGKVLLQNPVPL